MIHEYLIEKQQIDLFESLIPPIFRDEIERDRLFAVAAFDDRITPDRLMGITLVRLVKDWQEIAWVGMTDRYSRPEHAADLIRIRTVYADERGILFGTFSEFPPEETGRAEYYVCAGFSLKTNDSKILQIATDSIDSRSSNLSAEDEKHCFSLRYVTEKQKHRLEKDCVGSNEPLPLEIPVKWDDYDPDATILYERDGIVEAALFVIRHPDHYALEGIFGGNTPGSRAIAEYLKKYGAELFGDRPLFLIPEPFLSSDRTLPKPENGHTDRITTVFYPYDKKRKTRGFLSYESYCNSDEKDVLGLLTLDRYYDFSDRFDWDQSTTMRDERYFCTPARDKEAVFFRYRFKTEESMRRNKTPSMIRLRHSPGDEKTILNNKPGQKPICLSEFGFLSSISDDETEKKREHDRSIVEQMVETIGNTDDFKDELKRQIDSLSGMDELVINAKWKKLKDKPKSAGQSASYEKAVCELKKLMSQLTNLSTKVALFAKRKEFEGYGDILVGEIYASQIRTLSYYIDSTEAYLRYLYDGTPFGAMQGVFIKERIESDVPCPDPDVVLEEQIDILDPRFEGIAPWERDGANVFMIRQRMQERKRAGRMKSADRSREQDMQKQEEGFTGDDRPDEAPEAENAVSAEYCGKLLQKLEKKKLSHPELFREPMLTTVFSELPELCELFDEAFSVRNAAAQLFEKGREDIGVRKNIYIRACAIYDTLLRRSRYVMAAARTTMKEILKHQRDYHSCDYEYALGECGKIAENRETAIQRRNV